MPHSEQKAGIFHGKEYPYTDKYYYLRDHHTGFYNYFNY